MHSKIKYKTLMLSIVFFTASTLSGCWDANPFGEISFNLVVGVESAKEKKIMVTRSSPVFEERIQDKTETFIVDADSMRESREKTQLMSPNLTVGGKIQHVLFSKELARKGIVNYLEVFERDPTVPNQCVVVVVDGSPKELLKATEAFRDKPSPGYYLNRLFENNSKLSYIPTTEVSTFNIDYFSPGLDPIVPMISIARNENPAIAIWGCALFSGDKMVGELDIKHTPLLLAMMKKMKRTEYNLEISNPENNVGNDSVMIATAFNQPKVRTSILLEKGDKSPSAKISMDFKFSIEEFKWNIISKIELQKIIEENIAKKIKGECERIIKYTQQVGSDPLGIGNLVRAQYNSYWKSVKWEEAYKDVSFEVDVKVDVNQYGITK